MNKPSLMSKEEILKLEGDSLNMAVAVYVYEWIQGSFDYHWFSLLGRRKWRPWTQKVPNYCEDWNLAVKAWAKVCKNGWVEKACLDTFSLVYDAGEFGIWLEDDANRVKVDLPSGKAKHMIDHLCRAAVLVACMALHNIRQEEKECKE